MIKENQRLFNRLNIISDALIVMISLLAAFWLRYYVLPGGVLSVPISEYMLFNICAAALHLLTFAGFGVYSSDRNGKSEREITKVWAAVFVDTALLLSILFILHEEHYSRIALAINFVLATLLLTVKRLALRAALKRIRKAGYNQKRILLIGAGKSSERYMEAVRSQPQLGYKIIGCAANTDTINIVCLGEILQLHEILLKHKPDEVVSALEADEYYLTPFIINTCEKAGIKLSIVPLYSEYMPSNPQFDAIGNVPLMNIRRIPLDNLLNAFAKRLFDTFVSAILLVLLSPVMLACAIGVKLSSTGPIIFRQERLGKNKKAFKMYKFRSMRVNDEVNRWSKSEDDRRTRFGSFMRKYSLDELPQLLNVLKGDMSLVGPRPELEYFVEKFSEEVPLYMVKHLVRPGITGWAQVNDLRGDTSIKKRIEHDIYYIEQWSFFFDIKILLLTVFKGKFKNNEK